MKMRSLLIGAGLLAVGMLLGARIADRADPPPATANGHTPLSVTVVRAQRRAFADTVQVVGQTRSRDEVRVVAELPGLRVERLLVEAGDRVRAGQLVAVLDARSQRIGSERSGAELERARGEYERARTLVASQLVSREFFKQKQTAYEVARAEHDDARLGVQRTRVLAPAEGRVVRRVVEVGDLTDPTIPLFEIARGEVLELEAEVPEALVARLREDMPAQVEIAGVGGPVSGRIRLIQPSVDAASRTTRVRIRVEAGTPLPVGAFGQASIEVAQVEGWSIPRSALQEDAVGRFVWIVDGKGLVRRRAVTIALRTAETMLIAESLDGAAIVARAGPFLRENDRVRIAPGD
jgi:HlyD family secretion protein